jgi:ComF family protein
VLYTGGVGWRWVFSSALLTNVGRSVLPFAEKAFCGLFQQLFPDDCRVCGEPLRNVSRIPVCPACLSEPSAISADYFCTDCQTPFLNRFPLDEHGRCALCRLGANGFDTVYTFGSYEEALRELIHLFKYHRVRTLVGPLGRLLARAVPTERVFDLVVPMPLHWRKRLSRGYNQSELLAKEIGRLRGLRVKKIVRRVKATAPQAGLSNSKRRLNMQGAFAVRNGVDIKGLRVLLIDDVLTTGATASACAKVLKRAGAKHVAVAAVARTDRRISLDRDFFSKWSGTT